MNNREKAHFERMNTFCHFIDDLVKKGNVKYSRSIVRKLKRFKKAMEPGENDKLLGELTRNRLAIADEFLAFFEALKVENELIAHRHLNNVVSLNKAAFQLADEVAAVIRKRAESYGV